MQKASVKLFQRKLKNNKIFSKTTLLDLPVELIINIYLFIHPCFEHQVANSGNCTCLACTKLVCCNEETFQYDKNWLKTYQTLCIFPRTCKSLYLAIVSYCYFDVSFCLGCLFIPRSYYFYQKSKIVFGIV